jgi:hypothetical protein
VSASCEHGSEGSVKSGNIFIAVKPLLSLPNDGVLHGIVWVTDPECGVSASTCLLKHILLHQRRLQSERFYGDSTLFSCIYEHTTCL